MNWLDGDETVPKDWMVRHVEGKTRKPSSVDEHSVCLSQVCFQHMIKENYYSEESIKEMREKLKLGWEDDVHQHARGLESPKSKGSTNGHF